MYLIYAMKSFICVLVCSLLGICACSNESVQTANPDASEEARNLLDFLYKTEGKYILSGQHDFITSGTKYNDLTKEATGRTPLIWGSDFSFCQQGGEPIQFQHCGPINLPDPGLMADFDSMQSLEVDYTNLTPEVARRNLVATAIGKHREGCMITLMWHACPPGFGDCCDGSSIWSGREGLSEKDWSDLTTEGTELNRAWKVQADTVASYLGQLRDAGVPVLWRPYHQMNGEWFWWGNRKGENGFRKLWIMMFDYFVHHHGLNNLLWVWNPNAPRDIPGDAAYGFEDFWPGSEFVDILAVDIYGEDWKESHYRDLLRLADGKPIAIGVSIPPPDVKVLESQNGWVWFMAWGNRVFWGDGIERLNALYDSGRALGLEDISLEKGHYRVKGESGESGRP